MTWDVTDRDPDPGGPVRWFPVLMPPSGASAQHPLGGGGRFRVLRVGRSCETSARRLQGSLFDAMGVKVGCFPLSLGPGDDLPVSSLK